MAQYPQQGQLTTLWTWPVRTWPDTLSCCRAVSRAPHAGEWEAYRKVVVISDEQEGMLVALIPMKDSRLRPRRTHIWVCLAVFVSLTVAGLLIFFILPRSVNITTTQPYLDPVGPVYINVPEGVVTFKLRNRFNVSNQNYFEITVNSVLMTVLYDTKVLAETKNTSLIAIPMRSNRLYNVDIGITFDRANQMDYMVYSCQNPIRWAHELVMLFQFTCSYSVLGHSEESTLNTYQFVSCYSDIKPSTIAPVITTTNSTTTTVTTRPAPTAVTASNVTNVPP
ncbi:transmembrane protein 106B-like isoform X2 [Dreissena polymorpha]|uniref:transmembrane protein 106B-like isoform X2 n=1 Tax=Dreissena polymorpha TaxID=45954 RepID=UPI002264BADD|nr:transmembrane protein 106B-like isoform X2 [Dreissena polymorpha]